MQCFYGKITEGCDDNKKQQSQQQLPTTKGKSDKKDYGDLHEGVRGSYCPSDSMAFCFKDKADYEHYKSLQSPRRQAELEFSEMCLDPPYPVDPKLKAICDAGPDAYFHSQQHGLQQQPKITNNNEVNNKITNKYTIKTNIITPPPTINQQKFNGSYQGTINARFIEYTDMPAISTVIVPTATTKIRNVLQPSAFDITGELKNIGLRQAKFISMVITVYDKFNHTLALENTSPQPNSILPGQSAPFKFSIGVADGLTNRTQDVASIKYHWTWFDENGNQH